MQGVINQALGVGYKVVHNGQHACWIEPVTPCQVCVRTPQQVVLKHHKGVQRQG